MMKTIITISSLFFTFFGFNHQAKGLNLNAIIAISYSSMYNPILSRLTNIKGNTPPLIVVDNKGNTVTVAEDIFTTIKKSNGYVIIPIILTPNGNNFNDGFFIEGKNISSISILITSISGEKIFETTNIKKGWDGTYKGIEVNTSDFIYTVWVSFNDGSRIHKTGDLTIVK